MSGMSFGGRFDSMLAREVDAFMGDGDCDDHDPNDKFCECMRCSALAIEAAEQDEADSLYEGDY